jgi:hypothetical protein
VDLIAQKSFKYKGRRLAKDDEFTADGKWGELLQRTGQARLKGAEQPRKRGRPKALRPAPSSETISNDPDVYNRRDITQDDLDTH